MRIGWKKRVSENYYMSACLDIQNIEMFVVLKNVKRSEKTSGKYKNQERAREKLPDIFECICLSYNVRNKNRIYEILTSG